MAERFSHSRMQSMHKCVNKDTEGIPGSIANTNGALFYHVQLSVMVSSVFLMTLRELACVVCTK